MAETSRWPTIVRDAAGALARHATAQCGGMHREGPSGGNAHPEPGGLRGARLRVSVYTGTSGDRTASSVGRAAVHRGLHVRERRAVTDDRLLRAVSLQASGRGRIGSRGPAAMGVRFRAETAG